MEGKILAAQYARTERVPYLGICLGMQLAVVEFARNVLSMPEANSTEFNQVRATRAPYVGPPGIVHDACTPVEYVLSPSAGATFSK